LSENVDLDVMIGGPQGGGIESSGQMTLRVFMIKGYDVFGIFPSLCPETPVPDS